MPAYFSDDFQYKKSDISDLKEIYNSLVKSGLVFKSGYYLRLFLKIYIEKNGIVW